jgi:ectoine hydroxylase-related dioxygenase (phytanoyl-CoA dioxygenase family)
MSQGQVLKQATLTRAVTANEVDLFTAEGVVHLPGMLAEDAVEQLRQVIEDELEQSWRAHHPTADVPTTGRFHNDGFLWRRHDLLRKLCLCSGLPETAAQLMDSSAALLLMDEVFVKEPGTNLPVPWHTDISYWPMSGRQMLSFWIALDDVDTTNGAVQFRVSSHKWATVHRPTSFLQSGSNEDSSDAMLSGDDDITSWSLVPGDAIAFHAYTLHHSPGNSTTGRRRRAYSIRYGGADVRYDPRPGTSPMMTVPGLTAGAELPSDMFPTAWPR